MFSSVMVLLAYFYRVVVQHMPEFKRQKDKVTWHIESDFTQEMSSKSTTVS